MTKMEGKYVETINNIEIPFYWGCIIKEKGSGFSNTTYKLVKISDLRKILATLIVEQVKK